MKVIDSRSGQIMSVGQTVIYPDGESMTLLEVRPGLFSAEAKTEITNSIVTREQWVPLTVRWMHPKFLLQHVAFIPS